MKIEGDRFNFCGQFIANHIINAQYTTKDMVDKLVEFHFVDTETHHFGF